MSMSKLAIKVIGIGLAAVLMIASVLGGWTSLASAQSEPSARIDRALLNLIDEYAGDYYRDTWNLTLDQYKAWIATIAWAETNGRYGAHSLYGRAKQDLSGDRFNHVAANNSFRFSTGIGPFQMDLLATGGVDWAKQPTINKLNPEEALISVLKYHHTEFLTDNTLSYFSNYATFPWLAVKGTKAAPRWREVTGTDWDAHRSGKVALDWTEIVNKIAESRPLRDVSRYVGMARWDVSFTTDAPGARNITIDGYNDTWLITVPQGWDGSPSFEYYYTYDHSKKCEVWVWRNTGQEHEFRYIFARDYSTGRFPESRTHEGAYWVGVRYIAMAGFTLDQPALNPRDLQSFQLSFPLPNRNAYNAVITSVFDHSMYTPYRLDGKVIAYTGETAKTEYGSHCQTIGTTTVCGYKNNEGGRFTLNGHYYGGAEVLYLYYDGHPGYDYRTRDQSPDGKVDVLASAGGKAYLGSAGLGAIYIDHGNGYRTYYFHLSERNVTDGQLVERGEVIGISGAEGSEGNPHLHFEVRKHLLGNWVPVDPYGWRSRTADDRYYRALGTNKNLWGVGFVPIDLVLVLDRSGSMGGSMGTKTRLQGAKDASIAVVDMLMPHDRVAVVSFDGRATTNVQLTDDFEHAKTAIQSISLGGMTSFGAGLELAVDELKERGTQGHVPVIIFLSDGRHNTSPAPHTYVQDCIDHDPTIPIYTVGLGANPGEVGEALLKWMAAETGGEYFFVTDLYDLENVFLSFTLQATGWPVVGTFTGTVAQGETVVAGNFTVEPGTEYARVTLNWPGSDLDLVIERPDGNAVELGTGQDNIYSGDDAKPEWVILLNPEAGTWIVKVYGKVINPHSQYIVWVSTYIAPTGPRIPSTYKFEYSIPDPIMVATDVDIDVTFMTDEEKDVGYDGVRFRFEADGPGDVSFRATDSEGVEHTFMNSGFWGPESGFDLPASYNATTSWTLNFLHKAGDYTITFSLIEAPDGDVIADITETVTVTVKPLPAAVTIDPETLNLQAPAKWITAYIELPEEYAAEDIDVGTVQLIYDGSELYADWGDIQDGVFMAKFDWVTVAGWFDGLHDVDVELTIVGEVAGVDFEGTDTIRVIDPPRRRGRG